MARDRRSPLNRGITALALAAMLAAGCSLDSPSAPSWEITLSLPLFNQFFELPDLLEDEDFLPVGVDSLYALQIDEDLGRFEVGDEVTLDPVDETVSEAVGVFQVPAAQTETVSVLLPDLLGATLPTGTDISVPDTSFSHAEPLLSSFSGFTQVTISSGTVDIRVDNYSKVEFDSLSVRLVDDALGGVVITTLDALDGPPLTDGTSRTTQHSLNGLSFSNDISLELFGHTPGGTVNLDGFEGIDVEVTLSDLQVASATGRVDPIDFTFNETVALTDASVINYAILSGGDLTLELDNQLPVPLQLDIQVPDVLDQFGSPLNVNLNAGQSSLNSVGVDLTGHTITPYDDGSGTQTIRLNVQVHSNGSAGNQVTLASTDSVFVRATVANAAVEEVSGILEPKSVTLDEDTFELDGDEGNLLEELRKVDFTAIQIELEVRSTIDFPASATLSLIGEGGEPTPVQVDLDIPLPASGSATQPDTTVHVFTETSHPDLLLLLNAVPTLIRYGGTATVGDGAYTGEVSSTSYLEVDLRIDLPVLLDITEPIVIETDKTEEPEGIADEDSTSGIRFQEATLTYQLASTSGLPVRARFLVARDSANVFTAPDLEFVLNVTENVTAAVDTTIVLTRAQWEILMGPVWTAAKVTIPTTTQPVMVRKNDRIWAKAFVTARVLIDPDAGNGGGGGR